ncbi:unnamed protein product, partial [Polarella glacialis]
ECVSAWCICCQYLAAGRAQCQLSGKAEKIVRPWAGRSVCAHGRGGGRKACRGSETEWKNWSSSGAQARHVVHNGEWLASHGSRLG